MEPPRQKWLARLALAVIAASAAAWFYRTDFNHKVSTDILDLIPSGERAPELTIVRSLAAESRARVVLFALEANADDETRAAATDAFVERLRRSPAISEVAVIGDVAAREALARRLFDRRFDLLLPSWLAARDREYMAANPGLPWTEWLAETTAARLDEFLTRPEAMAFGELVPADPLLLLPDLAEAVQGLEPPAASSGPALIWALASASPLREEGQQPLFAAVSEAFAGAEKIAPDAKLRWTAIARFAAESRTRIQHELATLNLLSLAAVVALAAACLRQIVKSIHLVPVILGGLLGGWMTITLAHDRVHILVFVVGSLLAGVAVDYGFYLYLQPPAYPNEPYRGKVRRLLKPLLVSALTTIAGFSVLLWSELPLIRQLGLFVSAGLIAALGTALLWFGPLILLLAGFVIVKRMLASQRADVTEARLSPEEQQKLQSLLGDDKGTR